MIVCVATPDDAPGMAEVINTIIAVGGTTAHQSLFTPERIVGHYIASSGVISCHVAQDTGTILGFQVLERLEALPAGWVDIGTFVAPGRQRGGIGAALMAATLAAGRAAGVATVNATIRADNAPGLAYYARHGFADYAVDTGWRLADGTQVGRVSRRLDL